MLTKTVRDVVLEVPAATRIFEQLRIDYCCGGDVPLAEACSNRGFELNRVMRLLKDAARAQHGTVLAFRNCSLRALTNYIVDKHHTFTRDEMIRLEALSRKVLAAHSENHPELIHVNGALDQLLADLGPHMFKEEQILFPYIIDMEKAVTAGRKTEAPPFGSIDNPIQMMRMEHEDAGEFLRSLREASLNYVTPADGGISYQMFYRGLEAFERDLHQHIHLENNILFPRAIELERNARLWGNRSSSITAQFGKGGLPAPHR